MYFLLTQFLRIENLGHHWRVIQVQGLSKGVCQVVIQDCNDLTVQLQKDQFPRLFMRSSIRTSDSCWPWAVISVLCHTGLSIGYLSVFITWQLFFFPKVCHLKESQWRKSFIIQSWKQYTVTSALSYMGEGTIQGHKYQRSGSLGAILEASYHRSRAGLHLGFT